MDKGESSRNHNLHTTLLLGKKQLHKRKLLPEEQRRAETFFKQKTEIHEQSHGRSIFYCHRAISRGTVLNSDATLGVRSRNSTLGSDVPGARAAQRPAGQEHARLPARCAPLLEEPLRKGGRRGGVGGFWRVERRRRCARMGGAAARAAARTGDETNILFFLIKIGPSLDTERYRIKKKIESE